MTLTLTAGGLHRQSAAFVVRGHERHRRSCSDRVAPTAGKRSCIT
jgi:hypothetical protein